jgi:radical SAM protein with 4Fe4S-binding SPASM domain
MPSALDPPLPDELQVEVTGACNLRCRMCLVRYRPPKARSSASMKLGEFVALLDALPGLRRLTLQGLGEPMLAPGLFEMIDAARARGIEVGFNTNATLLSRDDCRRLVDAGVAWVHVSVDGATPETFEHIRAGARFDGVVENLASLVEAKRDARSATPRLQLNVVVMRSNLSELPAIVRLAARLGVARCWVQSLSHDFSDTDADAAYAAIRDFVTVEEITLDDPATMRVFAEARREAKRCGIDLRLPQLESAEPRRRDERACDWPWTKAYVTHDQLVQPCCMVMGSERATLGDLKNESFAKVWHGDAYRAFREALQGDDPPEVCRGCSLYRRTF